MESEFIYNPHGVGSQCHSACLAEHEGTLFLTWYGYVEKEYEKGQICLAEYDDQSRKWKNNTHLFPHLSQSDCGNPVLFSDPNNGSLHLFFVILQQHYWDSAQIYHSFRKEGEKTWSSPERLELPMGMMVRHRPHFDKSGKILIPAYDEKSNKTIIYTSNHPFTRWNIASEIDGELIQGDLIYWGGQEFQIYLRPAGDSPHQIFRALSSNNCNSFDTVLRTTLSCPLSGIAAIRLKSGDVVLCHNNTSEFKRTPISLSIVKKGEVTYNNLFNLDEGPLELSYPNLIQRKNGEIHLVYTYNRRMIKHCFLNDKIRSEYGF